MQISIELKEIMQNSEFIYYLIMWNVIVYKWSILAMIDSKCMLQNFHESRVEPRASRAESTPGLARGSALQLTLQLTSRANPLLGSARATFCSARLARDARRAGSALCQPCLNLVYKFLIMKFKFIIEYYLYIIYI